MRPFNGRVNIRLLTLQVRIAERIPNPRIVDASRRVNILFDRWIAIRDALDPIGLGHIGLGHLLCQWKVNRYHELLSKLRAITFLTDGEIRDLMWGSLMLHSGERYINRRLASAAIIELTNNPSHLASHDLCEWVYSREGGTAGRHDLPTDDRRVHLRDYWGRDMFLLGRIGLTTEGRFALRSPDMVRRMGRALEISMVCPDVILGPGWMTLRRRAVRLGIVRPARYDPHEGMMTI